MAANIRASKFKHIYGSPQKKEECFDDIPISKSAFDTSFCDVNPKFLAVLLECSGGGSFLVMPLDRYGRQSITNFVANGHSKPVTDLKWCPHDDNIIASASDDCSIKIWNVEEPETEVVDQLKFIELATLSHHQRRVNLVLWHPSVKNVLLSAGADNLLVLWNLETTEIIAEHTFDKPISSGSFNFDGSRLVVGLKDGHVAILDAKTLCVLQEAKCYDSFKPTQVAYLRGERILTTGFTKSGSRLYSLWNADDLSKCIMSDEIDKNNGVLFIHYDADLNVIFLVGKGDSVVRYFEYDETEAQIFYLSRFDTQEPQKGFGFMGKRGVNVSSNEITRMYKLLVKRIEVIPFMVPRKSDQFQRDLYPDTPGHVPALTLEEWLAGKDSAPVLISLEQNFCQKGGAAGLSSVVKRSVSSIGGLGRKPTALRQDSNNETKELQKKVAELEKALQEAMQRIAALESKLVDA